MSPKERAASLVSGCSRLSLLVDIVAHTDMDGEAMVSSTFVVAHTTSSHDDDDVSTANNCFLFYPPTLMERRGFEGGGEAVNQGQDTHWQVKTGRG